MSEEYEEIDWESPDDVIRSSEVTDITLKFLDNGVNVTKLDDKDVPYKVKVFSCIHVGIKKPREIEFTSSSKRFSDAIKIIAPPKGKTLHIVKTGTLFNTQYSITEVKSK